MLFDRIIPEYRDQLGPGFLEGAEQHWEQARKLNPKLPPFSKLGPASALMQSYRNAQEVIMRSAGDYQELSQHLLFVQLNGQGHSTAIRPWSLVATNVYERTSADQGAMGPGTIEIRVVSPNRGAQVKGGMLKPASLEQGENQTAEVPFGNVMGYPLNCNDCQTTLGGGGGGTTTQGYSLAVQVVPASGSYMAFDTGELSSLQILSLDNCKRSN